MEEEKSITLGDIFKVLKKNIIVIAISFVLCSVLGGVYAYTKLYETYSATTRVVVAVEDGGRVDYSDTLRLINSYGEIVTDDFILAPVAEKHEMSTSSLRSMVKVTVSDVSFFIQIKVTHTDKKLVEQLALDVSNELIKQSEDNAALKKLGATLRITSNSQQTNVPNKKLYILIGAAVGLVLSFGFAFCREFLSNKFKTKAEIESLTRLNVLSTFIDNKDKKDDSHTPELLEDNDKEFENYNKLITNIRYASTETKFQVIEITSTLKSELKSTTVCNLACALAKNKKKVLVIDLDTHAPVIHKAFGLEKAGGLVEYIDGTLTKDKIIKHTDRNVDIITFGRRVTNPIIFLESSSLKNLVEELRSEYDYILVDTPPVLAYSDALVVSKFTDGILYNVSINMASKKVVVEAINNIRKVNAKIIGVNITKMPLNSIDNKYDYYYYYYNKYYPNSDSKVKEAK